MPYFDVIPANTTYIPGTLAILTNEGKVYKTFTDALGDDAGGINGTNVRINLGYKNAPTATAIRRGRITYNDKPSFYGATCILIATYHVKVTGGYGVSQSGRRNHFLFSIWPCDHVHSVSPRIQS